MKDPKAVVRWTAIAVGAVYALTLRFAGVELDGGIKQAVGYLPTAIVLAVVAFDAWLWKLPLSLRIHKRPRIDGLWRTIVKPDAKSKIPRGGNKGPILGYTVINQSFWSMSVIQFTEESRSDSRAAEFLKRSGSDRRILSFTYENVPQRQHLDRSPRSSGACDLAAPAGRPSGMEGSYFTDRFTAGTLELELIDRTTGYESFKSASSHAESQR